ncbi:hypothetical protein ACLB90_07645 [Stenotrophomonas sp. LGBM10]|uniref:hypothetical protein n=1 Tax=Stenotrophomonas sp. LGBM10 TaxID=3390038 RepID=UPI00398B7BE6
MNTRGDYAIPEPHATATVAVVTPAPVMEPPHDSAVSWAAIFAGAAAAAALSLVLLILGVGLGLSSVSPWAYEGVTAETFGWSSIAWLTFTAIAASGLGGYLAGRLRSRWSNLHGDETYFRDTAHGFLSWSVATLLTAGLLTTAIGGVIGAGAKVAGASAGAAATTAGGLAAMASGTASGGDNGDLQYWVDGLFRPTAGAPAAPMAPPPVDPAQAGGAPGGLAPPPRPMVGAERGPGPGRGNEVRAEVNRIVVNSLASNSMDPADTQYLAQLVAAQTGLSQVEAQARVADMQTRLRAALEKAKAEAKQAADDARKATAYAALWLFITLLIGAFSASLFATWGGRRRDL